MREFELHRPCRAHIAENHHGAGDLPILVVDRGDGVFEHQFNPVAPDEHGVRGKADGLFLPNGHFHGIRSGFTRVAVDDTEHVRKSPAGCLGERPPRQSFRNRVEIRDVAFLVGADHAVANGFERELRAFSLHKQRLVHRRAFQYVS